MKEDKHMQTTPPVGIYVKVPHLSHLILSGSAFIGEISNTNHQQFKITIFKWLLHISLANYIQHCKKDHSKPHVLLGKTKPGASSAELAHLHDYSTQPLPAALLHLIGCDRLCPEAIAGLATTT